MICFIVLTFELFGAFFKWQLFILLNKYLMAAFLYSCGLHESVGIIVSVVVGFLYTLKDKLS